MKIIIIGAGILGATTAYKLAKAGAEVIVVDRDVPGQATDAAAGIVCPWLTQRRNKAWYHIAKNGASMYPTLIEELIADGETDTGYKKVGAIYLHHAPEKLQALITRAIQRKEAAPEIGEISLLDSIQLKDYFPPVADDFGAVHISGAARVNGRAIRNALLNGAKKYGAKILIGDARLIQRKAVITGVSLAGEIIDADLVIATAGAWMGELLKQLDINFHVYPQRGQILHLRVDYHQDVNWPVVMPPNNLSIVPFHDRIVIGATHEDHVGFENHMTAGGLHEILTKTMAVAPGLAKLPLLETRVGFRPFTPGFLPIIGKLPGLDGLLLANGLGASGLTTGPYLGSQLAKLALGQDLEIDLMNYAVASAMGD